MSEPPHFGLGVPNGGDFADPDRLVQLAVEAERAGWDGLFLWDHVIRRRPWKPMVDPWIALAAIAVTTERLVLGPMVTPLARRRMPVVARQTVTLDHLAAGRLRLGVGLGAPIDEFTRFGEEGDERHRGDVLDESLELLELLWTGEPVTYTGGHLTADDVQFLPRPVGGRVPIWVAGRWPGGRPFRRAARFDGVWPVALDRTRDLTVDEFVACLEFVTAERRTQGRDGHFDACCKGRSKGPDDQPVLDDIGRMTAAGLTWWIDDLDVPDEPFEQHLARVQAGPPHVS